MDTGKIDECLKSIDKNNIRTGGVFACDELPDRSLLKNKYVVVNFDKKNEPGSHWIVIGTETGGGGSDEYFDSFGLPPINKLIEHFLMEGGKNHYESSQKSIQHPLSTVCGQYCIFFIYCRCSGLSFSDFIKMFNNIPILNDAIVNCVTSDIFNISYDMVDVTFVRDTTNTIFEKIYTKNQRCKTQSNCLKCIVSTFVG